MAYSSLMDVTGFDAKIGDEVIIFDDINIKLDELADICDTINYEIISTIGKRVDRFYV